MQNSFSRYKTFPLFFIIFCGLALISACSQNVKPSTVSAQKATKESTNAQDAVEKQAQAKVEIKSRHFPPKVMYQVLVAELLVKQNQAASAFPLMFEAAKESQDSGLAERAFQLSMATFNLQSIEKATTLWREIAPEEALPWKASYLMSVREGNLDVAFWQWQAYNQRVDAPLTSVLIESGLKVSQSATSKNGLTFLKKLQETYPKEAASYFAFGVASINYGENKLAIPALEKSAEMYHDKLTSSDDDSSDDEISPEKMERESYLLLVSAYLKSGQSQLGMKKLKPYLDEHDDDWEFQEKYARLEVKAGLFKAAEKRYLHVLKNEPKAFTSRLSVALLQLERQDYTSAISNLKQLQLLPEYHSTATYYLGLASQGEGQFKEAVKYYKSVKTDDYFLDAQLHIAEIKYPDIGLEKTLAQLNKLEAKDNEQKEKLYRAQAIFYKLADKKQQAVEAYQSALQLDPNNVNVLLAQAMLYYDLKQYPAYEKNIKMALKIEPDDVEALNALAYFYVENKQHLDEAKVLLDKALSLAPNRYYILDSRGWLSYQQGNYQEAESYLEKAFDLQRDDEVLIHLIKAKWKLGKTNDATDLWNRYHSHFPDNVALQKILSDLKK